MSVMKKDIVNILFGDSIAYGLYDNEYFGWFNRLRNKSEFMQKQFYLNLSVPGQCSGEILKRFELEIKNRINNQDIFYIVFAFGINDALKLKSNKSYEKMFENNILKLISLSKKYTNNICFLGLFDVDFNIRIEYDQACIDIINSKLELLCKNNQIKFINMKDVINTEDLYDGLHPNEIGHEKISEYIYKSLIIL